MNKGAVSSKLGEVSLIIAGGDKPKEFSTTKTDRHSIPVYANGETNEGLQGYTDKAKVNKPSVTISARGTIGYAVLRQTPFVPIVRLLTLIPNDEVLDVKYLYYYLTLYRQKGLGSSQAQLTVPDIANRKIRLPNLNDQKLIGNVLHLLDEKIRINNKLNSDLENLAKTIYDYWFVQFEFPDKQNKPYKSNGGQMVFEESIKRHIPKGWRTVLLKNISTIIMGQSPKGTSYNNERIGIPLLNGPADYENGSLVGRTYTTEPTRLCQKDDLVFCIRATIGNLTYAEKEFCLGRGVAGVRVMDNKFSEYVYFALLQEIEKFKIQASGSIIVGITKEDLTDSIVIEPDLDILSQFHDTVYPILQKMRSNKMQNLELAELRDWLLPLLMNGQIKIQ